MSQIKSQIKGRQEKKKVVAVIKSKDTDRKKKINYSHVERTFGMFEDRKEEILQYLKELRNEE